MDIPMPVPSPTSLVVKKGSEYFLFHFFTHSDAVVLDAYRDLITLHACGNVNHAMLQLGAVLHVFRRFCLPGHDGLAGINNNIHEYLIQLGRQAFNLRVYHGRW